MDKKKKILISISSLLAVLVIAVLILTATGTFDSILNPNISTNALETDDVSSRNAKLSTSSPISSQITYMDEYGHEIENYSDVEHGSTVKVLVNKTDAETETEYALYSSYYRDNNNKTYKLDFTETEDGYESEFIVPDTNTVTVSVNAYAAESAKTMKAEHNGIEVSLTSDAIPQNATDFILDTEASFENTNSLLNLSGHQSSYVFNAALYNNKKETNLDGDTYMEINGILNDIPEGSSAIVNMYHILDSEDAISAAIENYDLYLGPTKSSDESEDNKDKETEYGQFMSGNIIKITEKDLSKKYPKETKMVQSISGEKDTIYCQVNTLGDGSLWEDNGTVYAKIDSLSTYAYTVDFTYNDYTYSIPGESSIKLSELIEILEIDIDISDVTDVTFTNESLVRIDKEDGDWNLVSLVAFKSDELLSLQMSNGNIVNIKVTDNSGSWSDISYENVTVGASWEASCSVSGSTVTVNITVNFEAVKGDQSEYQLWVNGTKQKTDYQLHYVGKYPLSYSYTVTADSTGKVTPAITAITKSYNSGTSYTIGTISPTLTYAANYTVTYNSNGGSGTMDSSTATYGQSFTTRQNGYSRAGYTFVGWNEASDGSDTWWDIKNYYHGSYSYGASGSYGVYEGAGAWTWSYAKNITLYAQWKANTINVTLDQNGGTGGSTSMKITYNTAKGSYPDITIPTKTGYTFNGYYTNDGTQYLNSAGNSVRTWDIAYDTTLYAHWTATQGTIYYMSGNDIQGVYGTAANNSYCNGLNYWKFATLNGSLVASSWSIESTAFDAWNVASLFTPPTGYNYASETESYYIYNYTKKKIITVNKTSDVWRKFDQGSINFKDLVTTYPTLISYGDTLHFYAIYTPKTVTVKFNGNSPTGGAFASTQTFTYGVSNQKFTGTLEKTGYSFAYWGESNSATSGYSLNCPVADSWINEHAGTTVNLYAIWSPINRSTFYYTGKNYNYANATEITDYAKSNVTMVDGTKPTGISQNGFLGKAGSESGSAIETHNITSTAFNAWNPNALFVAPAGYSYPWNGTKVGPAYRIQIATTDWKTSYWLTGTSSKATGTSSNYEDATVFDGDSVDVSAYWNYHLLLFPDWQLNTYTITYKDGNNTITSGLGGSYNSTYTIEDKVSLPTYSKSYYTFNGWRLTAVSNASDNGNWGPLNTTTFSSGQKFTNTGRYGNATLTAIFTPNTYSITINNDGSTYKTIYEVYATRYEETKGSGTSISKITIPTKAGYEFVGAYTGKNGAGTQVIDANGNIVTGNTSFTSDTTIYVYWKAIGYFVNYNGNGSTGGSMSTQLIYSNQPTALTKNAFTKEGYTFVGWTRDTSTEVVYYKNQASVIDIANPGETITLYAVWQDDNAMIFVDSNTGDYPIISSTATNTGYKYMIQETASTPGYIMDGTIYVVDVNEKTMKYTVTSYTSRTNAENGTNGTVITKDASIPSTGKQAGLVNVQFENTPNSFELTKTNTSGTVITSGVTNAKVKFWTENASNNTDYIATTDNGITGVKNNTTLAFDSTGKIKLERLTPGTWYYQEISAPTGYTIDSSVHSFVVTENGYINGEVSYSEKLVNTPASEIYLAVKKINEHTGAAVSDVKFELSTSSDFSTSTAVTTNSDGLAVLFKSGNNPTSTTYYLREASLSDQSSTGKNNLNGMLINSDVYKIQFNSSYSTFTVTNITSNTILVSNTNVFTLQHANPTNEWNIYKYDENDEPLSDVTFRLWNNTGFECELTTDESGYTETIYGLPSGQWYYQEISTNDGYLLDDAVYSFKVDPDTYEITYDEVSQYYGRK